MNAQPFAILETRPGPYSVVTVNPDETLLAHFNGSLAECEQWIFLAPFFQALPGGPAALNNSNGEEWQYMGPFAAAAFIPDGMRPPCYQFRHRSHPGYNGARVLAILSPADDFGETGAVDITMAVGPLPVGG